MYSNALFGDISSIIDDMIMDELKNQIDHMIDHPTITAEEIGEAMNCLLSEKYFEKDKDSTYGLPKIENVIFAPPATIIKWNDGTKTVVQCSEDDEYNRFYGFVCCIAKKVYGNAGRFNAIANKWIEKDDQHIAEMKRKEKEHRKNVEADRRNHSKNKKNKK